MGYYKITNVTNTLGKRHGKVNTVQVIDFKDIINSSSFAINPGSEITVEANYLPISAQKLRTEGLITVVEIDKNAYQKMLLAQEANNQVDKKQNNTSSKSKESKKDSDDSSDKDSVKKAKYRRK